MIEFYDLLFNNEIVTIEFDKVEDMTIKNGHILITHVDGLFYETEKVLFL